MNWFAVWTRSRHEHVVQDHRARRDIEVFLPTIIRWSRWKDRKKQITWPLFPGYCFDLIGQAVRVEVDAGAVKPY